MQNRHRGATMVEYCFIAALVLVTAIGVLYALGGNLNEVMTALRKDLWKQSGASAVFASMGGAPGGANGIGGVVPAPGPGQKQVCYESGWCVNIPTVNPHLAGTTGAMGGELSESFTDVIRQIAQQLEESGGDPSLVSLITGMANDGHTLAGSQKAAEYYLGTVSPEQQSSNPYDPVAAKLARDQSKAQWSNVFQAQDDMNARLVLLNNILASHPGALPPEMHSIIQTEVGQINNIQNVYWGNVQTPERVDALVAQGMSYEQAEQTAWTEYYHSALTLNDGAAIIEQSANTVCNNGGDTSRCIVTTP